MQNNEQHGEDSRSWWHTLTSPFRNTHQTQKSDSKKLCAGGNAPVARLLPEDYERLYKKLGYRFQNEGLIRHALTHRSFLNEAEDPGIEDNERLEFFGDSVLGLVICDYLFRTYPNFHEGDLSRIKSHVVSEPFLAELAREIELGDYLLLGKGEAASGGHEKNSLLSDCYEAVIAAIYLDGGMEAAREFLMRAFRKKINTLVDKQHILDHKSLFQEHAQEQFGKTPRYKLREILGPAHDKTFEIDVLINKEVFSSGSGKSKKEAEQNAAKAALDKMNISTGKLSQP